METDSDTSSLLTLSDSLRSALFRWKGERRFQAFSADYPWPCDSSASLLELLTAKLLEQTYTNGLYWEEQEGAVEKLLSSEESDQHRLLDLGSGMTVSWSIAMAERFPDAECIGIDFVPADLSYLPPNLTIEVADMLEGLPYPDEFFDLVHIRAGTPILDNKAFDLLSDVSRILRPGGVFIIEDIHDFEHPFFSETPNNPHLAIAAARHATWFQAVMGRTGREAGRRPWAERLAEKVRKTPGFDAVGNVREKVFDLPMGLREGEGPAEQQTGYIHRESWLAFYEAIAAGIGLDEERIQAERLKDAEAFAQDDVGLQGRWNVIWAVKGVVES